MSTYFRDLIKNAQNELAYVNHTPAGFTEPTVVFGRKPALSGTLNLNAEDLPNLLDRDGQLSITPSVIPAGVKITLAAATLQASRVAAAGAHIIVRPDPDRAVPIGKGSNPAIGLEKAIKHFSTIEAAPFATVADDANASISALPVSRAELDWSESIAKAVRFEVTRQDRKHVGEDVIADEILLALILGLARTADAVLLAAIVASTPSTFSIGAAAAQDLRIAELRALIGTAGAGASWRGDGVLAAAGIPAELTANTSATIVGSFGRAAVAVHEDISVTVERRNTQSDLVVTCYANLIPLLPDDAKFWTVSA